MMTSACGSGPTVSQMLSLSHCLLAQPRLAAFHRPVQVKGGRAPGRKQGLSCGKGGRGREGQGGEWGWGREQGSHALLRLRGALASGDQLASITDFI